MEDFKFCSDCGNKISQRAEICPACGVRQYSGGSSRNRIAAALFALLLGGIGIHKFYLGSIVWGVVYFLLCWTFIPAIVGLIEGIMYLTMSENDFQRQYGDR